MKRLTPVLSMVHSSVAAMLNHTTGEFPERVALIMGHDQLTYDELRNATVGLARMLRSTGSADHRVATLLPNSIVACIAPYGIAAAGAQHVPLNPQYTSRELQYMLRDSAPRALIVDDSLASKVQGLVNELHDCKIVMASEIAGRLLSWRALPVGDALESLEPNAESMAILQYTGGSSGFPKGVNLSHRSISTNIAQREGLLPVSRNGERVICVMPLFHSYAMAMGLFLCGYSGSTLVVLPGYHPERVLESIGSDGITIFPGSPTIFTGLMASAAFAGSDWSRVHTCYSGSAALSAETLARWQTATRSPIYEGYGQTEAGPVLTFNSLAGPLKVGSVGVPVAATEVEIVDLESGRKVLPTGERGEIRARGPQVMSGYHNLPQETKEALRGGWLYTGDIGEFDADGCLYIRDRKKDLVIVGGYNVYPREVEEVLFTHPDVIDVAVVGKPDAYRGEILRAFLVLRDGIVLDAVAMRDFCAANLARYKIPGRIEQVATLPKTTVNKTDKKVLKQRVMNEA